MNCYLLFLFGVHPSFVVLIYVEISSAVNTSAWFFVGEDAGGYLAAATAYDLDDKNILGVIDFFGLTEWDYYLNKKKYTPMSQILTNLLDSKFSQNQKPSQLLINFFL